jgi:hypothetical protein
MSLDSLSLVGFLDQSAAMRHLLSDCQLADTAPAALSEIWRNARARLRPVSAAPGKPEILDLPLAARAHITQQAEPLAMRLGMYKAHDLSPPRYAMVEVAPLIAHQLTLDAPSADGKAEGLNAVPSLEAMLPICLPGAVPPEQFDVLMQRNALVITSRNPNLHFERPQLGDQAAIIAIRPAPPFVTVVVRRELCYLWDGYHRAYALARLGATHIPCMLRQSLRDDLIDAILERHFPPGLLRGAAPPTLGHFVENLAYPVTLKPTTRFMHVSWAEWRIADIAG